MTSYNFVAEPVLYGLTMQDQSGRYRVWLIDDKDMDAHVIDIHFIQEENLFFNSIIIY